MPRKFPSAGDVLDRREISIRRIDDENGNRVVATIGRIQKTSIWMDCDGGGGIFSMKAFRQRGDVLEPRQRAARTVPVHSIDGADNFIHGIRPSTIGMKCQIARTRSWDGAVKGRTVRRDFRSLRVEAVDHDAVQTQIVDQQITIVGRDRSAVRVRRKLPIDIDAVTFVIDIGDVLTKAAIGQDSEAGEAAAVIIRDK